MQEDAARPLCWWQTRRFVIVMAFLSVIPLLWPDVPPLVDLPGHMGRYRVQLDMDEYRWLTDWYDFRWSLIGNLGVDLLIEPLGRMFGLELGVKMIVLTIPPLIVVGLLWISREVHGRIPATALFALPLAYCFPLQFGFVNFMLSMALALPLFALWLRLARLNRFRLRTIIFVPLSCALWVCHTFGWGVLGVLAFSAEMVRQHDLIKLEPGASINTRLYRWGRAWIQAGLGCVPLALPLLLMVAWRSGDHVTGQTTDWFNWRAKITWLTMMLRDRWIGFDVASNAVIALVIYRAVRDPDIRFSRNLGLSALFLCLVYVLLPRIVFGSAYADMRLAPFMVAIAVIAIRPRLGAKPRNMAIVAALGLAFFVARTASTAASFLLFSNDYDRQLVALDHIPVGARLVTFTGKRCSDDWKMSRLEHMAGLALVRRLAYTNDQWSMPGAQLLTTRYVAAHSFSHDPSEIVTDRQCPREWWRPVDRSLALFPRAAFDYVWLISPPPYDPKYLADSTKIWSDGTSAVYKVNHTEVTPNMPKGTLKLPPRSRFPLF